ncbi:MAG TPA: hypothetical protein VN277_04875 [Acidiferrobacterales bacterium]|nr:hypothetical protein [Acidiferrobacterales bacterium]
MKAARDYHSASLDALTLAEPGQSCGPALSHAILAAIAYADAVTARKGQVVNQQDHRLAPRLLRDVLGNTLPDAQEKRYRRLLARKDEAQYGIRHIALQEAQRAVEDLEAFAEWAEVLLGGSGRNL